jgi:hypothetical protein
LRRAYELTGYGYSRDLAVVASADGSFRLGPAPGASRRTRHEFFCEAFYCSPGARLYADAERAEAERTLREVAEFGLAGFAINPVEGGFRIVDSE